MVCFWDISTVHCTALAYFGLGRAQLATVTLWGLMVAGAHSHIAAA